MALVFIERTVPHSLGTPEGPGGKLYNLNSIFKLVIKEDIYRDRHAPLTHVDLLKSLAGLIGQGTRLMLRGSSRGTFNKY